MRLITKFKRLYYTVKPLRLRQVIYRMYYKLYSLRSVVPSETYSSASWSWHGPEVLQPTFLGGNEVRYLNLTCCIDSAQDWNHPQKDKLWLYNLHYFDDLNAVDNTQRTDIQINFVKRWIAENPAVTGNGWEPYPISLRLVNWIKWYRRVGIDDQTIVDSIALQAKALTKQLEYHILGNHLFANAKALVFVGCFLQGKESKNFLATGLKILADEIPEQFLDDGGHFELSPMYHCILLWDLLDLINLAEITKNNELFKLLPFWKEVALKSLRWLKVMQHPDGEISFFNDSAFGIAASPKQLFEYAKTLGLQIADSSLKQLTTLDASGYSHISMSKHALLFDHAAVGPDYLPGHAHADTLSVEWSVGQQRVLVNSGTSVYGVSAERLRQRKTAAHNTVEVDNEDSSEVWSGFRVARRAYSKLLEANNEKGRVTLVACHDGYKRLKGRVIHKREVIAEDTVLTISDTVNGEFDHAIAHWHLHPSINAKQVSENELRLFLPNNVTICVKGDTSLRLVPSTWHPGFGKTEHSNKIIAKFITKKATVSFTID